MYTQNMAHFWGKIDSTVSLVSLYSTQKVAEKFPAIHIALIFMIETQGLLLTGTCFLCSATYADSGYVDQYNFLHCCGMGLYTESY